MSELKPRLPGSTWSQNEPLADSLTDDPVEGDDAVHDDPNSDDPSSDDPIHDDPIHDDLINNGSVTTNGRKSKRKRRRRRLTLAVLPTLLTLGNGVCGLAAIAIAVSTETLDWELESKLFAAGLLIFGGMLFDALDGSAARLTGQASRFGAELDSLCDAVTFGVAPAVIVWRISDRLPQRLTWAIGVLFALCVLIRLARFNVETPDDDDHEGFEGLPSPAAAGTLAAFAIAIPDLADFAVSESYPDWIHHMAAWTSEASHYFIPVLALVLAFLMVSRYQYPHVFAQLVRGRQAPHQIGQALFALVGLFLLHWVALPVAFCYYAFGSPIRAVARQYRGETVNAVEPNAADDQSDPNR